MWQKSLSAGIASMLLAIWCTTLYSQIILNQVANAEVSSGLLRNENNRLTNGENNVEKDSLYSIASYKVGEYRNSNLSGLSAVMNSKDVYKSQQRITQESDDKDKNENDNNENPGGNDKDNSQDKNASGNPNSEDGNKDADDNKDSQEKTNNDNPNSNDNDKDVDDNKDNQEKTDNGNPNSNDNNKDADDNNENQEKTNNDNPNTNNNNKDADDNKDNQEKNDNDNPNSNNNDKNTDDNKDNQDKNDSGSSNANNNKNTDDNENNEEKNTNGNPNSNDNNTNTNDNKDNQEKSDNGNSNSNSNDNNADDNKDNQEKNSNGNSSSDNSNNGSTNANPNTGGNENKENQEEDGNNSQEKNTDAGNGSTVENSNEQDKNNGTEENTNNQEDSKYSETSNDSNNNDNNQGDSEYADTSSEKNNNDNNQEVSEYTDTSNESNNNEQSQINDISIQVVDIQPFAIEIVTSSEETLDDNNVLDATNSYMAQYLKNNLDTDLKFISLTLKYLQSYPKPYSTYSNSNNGGNLRRIAESTGTEFYYSMFGTAIFATSDSIDEILVTTAMEESFSTYYEDSIIQYFESSGVKGVTEVSYNPSSFEVPLGSISSEEINNNEAKVNNKGGTMGKVLAVLLLFGTAMFSGFFIYKRRRGNRSDRTVKTIEENSQSPSKVGGYPWNNQSAEAANALRDADLIQEVTVPRGSPSERHSNDTSTLSGYTYGYTVNGATSIQDYSVSESQGQSTLFPVSVYGKQEKDLFPDVDFDEVWDVGTFMDDATKKNERSKHSVAFGKDGKVYGVSVRNRDQEENDIC